jgi:hypothetical protein
MKNKATVGEVLETQDIAGDISEITLVLTRQDPVKATGALAIALGTLMATLQKDPQEIYPLVEAYYKDALRVITDHVRSDPASDSEQQTVFDFSGDKKKAN